MTRMHAAEASFVGYVLPSSMGVRLRALVDHAPRPSYVYAYWSGIDTVSHLYGPRSDEAAMEAALFDLDLRRALGHRPAGDTLVLLTADHGHATTDPDKMLDMVGDEELRALLRNPPAGEARLVFLHTDRPAAVLGAARCAAGPSRCGPEHAHLGSRRWPRRRISQRSRVEWSMGLTSA